jgi:HPt (histidine-containing phosphotransfer) domain-containing protein
MFESAHAMKGVCANLGLDTLSDAASDIAEEFRPGNDRKHSDDEVREMLASITGMYRRVDEGITKYENS